MPIHKDFHPDYVKNLPIWTKCRDAFEGQEAVHDKGELYLPKLSGQKASDYKAYKMRALFYAITGKSISSMVGMATYKDPILKYPKELEPYFKENSGIQFYELYTTALKEVMLQGRLGVYVDRVKSNARPVTVTYIAENILNWDVDDEGNLIEVVLLEHIAARDVNDRFKKVITCQYRHLYLDNDGFVACDIYDNKGKIVGNTMQPTNRGVRMNTIPFYILGPSGINCEVEKSPALDIVNINLSHYRSSADLEHGRHFTGLPTPVVIGSDSNTALHIGSSTAWGLPAGGDAKYLEFTGQGLQSLQDALKEKETQLASLSARLLDNSRRGSEAAEAVKLRYMSETATLSSMSRGIESLLNTVYTTICRMENLDESELSIVLDKSFVSNKLTSGEMKELSQMFIDGTISEESYIYNLRTGERLDPNRTDDEELIALKARRKEALEAQKPTM